MTNETNLCYKGKRLTTDEIDGILAESAGDYTIEIDDLPPEVDRWYDETSASLGLTKGELVQLVLAVTMANEDWRFFFDSPACDDQDDGNICW